MSKPNELKTKEQIAYEQLKDLIIHGELPKNEFLSQRMLANRVDTTVINVRGALRQLENDGVIENVPQWGVRIPIEDEDSLRDRYFVREMLEIAAVKRIVAARPCPEAELLLERARNCDVVSSDPDSDVGDFARIHYDLHCHIVDASGSPRLYDIYVRVQLQTLMLWNAQRVWTKGIDRGLDWHGELVRSILEDELSAAIAKTTEHIQHGLENELEAIRAGGGDGDRSDG